MVTLNSEEAKTGKKAMEAIDAERQNFRAKNALDFDRPMEEDDAIREHPDAEFVDLMALLGQKHAEVADIPPEDEIWKRRGVVPGNNQRDVYGKRGVEEVAQTVPANMTDQRLGHAHQAFFDDGIGVKEDIDGACLTTLLGGKPKFLHITAWLFCLHPAMVAMMRKPVARIWLAFYGVKRAGADYGERARRLLKGIGFQQVRDVVMSVFIRWPVLLILYSDDL